MSRFVTSFLVGIFSWWYSVAAFACGGGVGWANPINSTASISFVGVIEAAKRDFHVEIKKSDFQARCGGNTDYVVSDIKSGQNLGTIPVSYKDESIDDGRALMVRTQQLLKTPREQLIAIGEARKSFYEDVMGMKEEFGIGAYIPNAMPFEERTENNGQDYLVFVYLQEYCSASVSQSPFLVYQGFPIKTLEYIPGRSDYSAGTIYQSGDLKAAVLSHRELVAEIQTRVQSNARYCPDDEYGKRRQWMTTSERLGGNSADLLKSSVDHFKASVKNPAGAYMVNEHRIVVELQTGKLPFAGTIREMVAIQAELAQMGVKVDRKTRLNWEGQRAVRFARERAWPLPLSLQE